MNEFERDELQLLAELLPSVASSLRSPLDSLHLAAQGLISKDNLFFCSIAVCHAFYSRGKTQQAGYPKLNMIQFPSKLFFMADSNGGRYLSYDSDVTQKTNGESISLRHTGGANFLHVDGHVAYRKRSEFPTTYRSSSYWT